MIKRFALLICLAAAVRAAPEYPGMGADIYDTKADGNALIASALARAASEHRDVLLVFGANWCIWCHRLHALFENDPRVAAYLKSHYELVMIDVNRRHGTPRNADVVARYGNPTRIGLPVLVVLDPEGRTLVTQDTGALENGRGGHDPAKVLAFLEKWRLK